MENMILKNDDQIVNNDLKIGDIIIKNCNNNIKKIFTIIDIKKVNSLDNYKFLGIFKMLNIEVIVLNGVKYLEISDKTKENTIYLQKLDELEDKSPDTFYFIYEGYSVDKEMKI